MPTSSTTNPAPEADAPCGICGQAPLCGGLGMVRYDLPIDHPDFGQMFRCPNNPPEQDSTWHERLRQLSNLGAFSDKTLANFDINENMLTLPERESLQYTYKKAQQFAEDPHRWLLLEGPYGCGKTHLAAAIGNARLALGDLVLFITAPDLLDHLRATYAPQSETSYDETFERMRNAPLLILDDLGVENPSPWAQEKLYQLFNHRYSHRLPTVITTNMDMNRLDPRIRSRLLDYNLVDRIQVKAPDYRSYRHSDVQLESNLMRYRHMNFTTFDTDTKATREERDNLRRVKRNVELYAAKPEGWLVILGGYHTGKTHLAAATAQYWENAKQEVMYVTMPDLLDYLRVAFSSSVPESFQQRLRNVREVPYLVLDDLDTENATGWAKEKVFQIMDYRYLTAMPTVITTSKEMDRLDERLATRLADRRICHINAITARSYSRRSSSNREEEDPWQR